MFLAVDPGLRKCGCALFGASGQLLAAALVLGELEASTDHARDRGLVYRTMGEEVFGWARHQTRLCASGADTNLDRLVIEFPAVRKRGSQREEKAGTDPNDIVRLSAVVGAILASVEAPSTVWLPEEWKGQVPKPIHNERALARLSPEELARVPVRVRAKDIDHNVIDGIAIGLHFAGRL